MSTLFTFVIGLVVVGAALAIAIRAAKPATRHLDHRRATPAEAAGITDITRWQRVRSGFFLVTLITMLGAAAALVLLVAGAIIVTGLRTAVQ